MVYSCILKYVFAQLLKLHFINDKNQYNRHSIKLFFTTPRARLTHWIEHSYVFDWAYSSWKRSNILKSFSVSLGCKSAVFLLEHSTSTYLLLISLIDSQLL